LFVFFALFCVRVCVCVCVQKGGNIAIHV
jgi:hypothetical protein